MAQVALDQKRIRVGDECFPLLSGEVHFWRLAPAQWPRVLGRVREMGLQIVATYVCWDFHEIERGRYDFRGDTDPSRDLIGFLNLLAEENLWAILRPGPYIYAEWRNGGVPDDAARHHRAHPAFRAAAREYMQAVVEATQPHLATRGGRIILLQADNEIDPWDHWYTEQLGLGRGPGPFQDFLRWRYATVSALNEAWGSTLESFDEARATAVLSPDPDRLRRHLDVCRFRHEYVNEVAAWTAGTYRELGVDVPIVLNAYSGTTTQRWADLEARADLAGPDIYPSRDFALRPDEHRHFLESVRYTRAFSRLPYIPEFEAGSWHGWHTEVGAPGPSHYRLACLSALLAGAAGWNWYMLVNRDNWYMSPINEWGRTRPDLFEAFRQIVDLFLEIDPTSLSKLADTAVTHDPLQRGTERPGQTLLQSLHAADIDYEFCDVNRPAGPHPFLVYAGGAWLSATGQENLLSYVSVGGHLLCLGAHPRFDDGLLPLNRLEIPEPPGVVSGGPEGLRLTLELGGSSIMNTRSPWMYNYAAVPGSPIVAERLPAEALAAEELSLHTRLQAGERYTVGYTRRFGKGRLTVLGLEPSPELLVALHRHFGIPIHARSRTPGISSALFHRGEDLYLIAVNQGDEAKDASVMFEALPVESARFRVDDLISRECREIDLSAGCLTFALARKDGTVLRLSPAT